MKNKRMTRPCRKYKKSIVLLVMGALGPAQMEPIHRHLEGCLRCSSYRAEISRTAEKVQAIGSFSTGRILAESKKDHGRKKSFRIPWIDQSFSIKPRAAIAFGLLAFIMVMAMTLGRHQLPSRASSNREPAAGSSAPVDLAPTFANYRAIANESLDELDDLLARQARRPLPRSPKLGAADLALVSLGD